MFKITKALLFLHKITNIKFKILMNGQDLKYAIKIISKRCIFLPIADEHDEVGTCKM